MPQVEQRPGKLDIGIVPGDDFTFTIHSSINLAGYTLTASSGTVTFTVSPTAGMPAGYYYDITITDDQSVLFASDLAWKLSWVDAGGKKRRIASGTIRILS
jgi:hypothetical protein